MNQEFYSTYKLRLLLLRVVHFTLLRVVRPWGEMEDGGGFAEFFAAVAADVGVFKDFADVVLRSGALEDGALQDFAFEEWALEDGAVEDSVFEDAALVVALVAAMRRRLTC
jgi:hypothetical protein